MTEAQISEKLFLCVTLVNDDEQIKAHKFVLRSITFICIIHNVTDNEHITDDKQVKAHKLCTKVCWLFPR